MPDLAQSSLPDGWTFTHLRCLPGPIPSWWPVPDRVDALDWFRALPDVLGASPGTGWTVFKDDASGSVMGGRIRLGCGLVRVVVKRPRATRMNRRALDMVRRGRARRAWDKTWRLIDAGFPTELPLILAERRWRRSVVTDQVAAYAQVPGLPLRDADFDAWDAGERSRVLVEAGRLLARINGLGLCHHDAKTSNWIVHGPAGRRRVVLLDCDGIRRDPMGVRRRRGIDRLLRALRDHPQVVDADVQAVEAGFASPQPSYSDDLAPA